MRRFGAFFVLGLFLFLTVPIFSYERYFSLTQLLQKHVREGQIDYKNLSKDPNLQIAINHFKRIDPDLILDREGKIAFWLNVYNLYTLKMAADRYPLTSVREMDLFGSQTIGDLLNLTAWDRYEIQIQNREYSLNDIVHEILREDYNDFRLHAALVCAAKSCPAMRKEAYEGHKLENQLDDQMRKFLASPDKNYYDPDTMTLYLSPVFDWFSEDFEKNGKGMVENLLPFFPPSDRSSLEKDLTKINIQYTKFDWSLNER